MGMIAEHFRVWLEKYLPQSLEEAMYVKNTGRKTRKKRHYSISFVERFRHDVLIIRDEAIKTKQTKGFLQKNEGRFHSTD